MNERIKELIEQASHIEVISGRGFDTTQYIDRFDKEKFAELIIKECAMVGNYAYDGSEYPGTMIKDYFGVK